MAMNLMQESGNPVAISASANICVGEGVLLGIFCSSASGTPTITVYDDADTGTSNTIVAVFTPVAATYYPMHMRFYSGCYIAKGGTWAITPVFASLKS